jgi:hypothetical protein
MGRWWSGIHEGLKIPWSKDLAGSNPARPTRKGLAFCQFFSVCGQGESKFLYFRRDLKGAPLCRLFGIGKPRPEGKSRPTYHRAELGFVEGE